MRITLNKRAEMPHLAGFRFFSETGIRNRRNKRTTGFSPSARASSVNVELESHQKRGVFRLSVVFRVYDHTTTIVKRELHSPHANQFYQCQEPLEIRIAQAKDARVKYTPIMKTLFLVSAVFFIAALGVQFQHELFMTEEAKRIRVTRIESRLIDDSSSPYGQRSREETIAILEQMKA